MKKLFLTTLFIFILLVPAGILNAATKVTPIKILIVPGHDNEVWGAQYGYVKEADMNLNLATRIYNALKKDKRFEVHITRKIGGYTKEFEDYLTNNREAISLFKESSKAITKEKVSSGEIIKKENPPHNAVTEDTAIKLYGINKWANENKMDAVIHVHFNDYPRKNPWTLGVHKGFVIYMPEEQMANAAGSTNLAKSIFKQLHKKYMTSTYEKELGGLIPDQSLIALGSNGTLTPSVRSILVEYGYIYRFKNKVARESAYTSMASLTVTGIKNYFFPGNK